MAIYRLAAQVISRGAGRSAIAAAAYRSGERLVDRRTGEVHDYTRRGGVLDRTIVAPAQAPDWALDRQELWSRVEAAEARVDAQLAREVCIALPAELSLAQQRELIHEYARETWVAHGMVADIAIHAPHAGGDDRNIHAHVMLTMRELDGDKFHVRKQRAWNDRALLEQWREGWERAGNRSLERAGRSERIDHRSLAEQGIEREPEPKQGPRATAMERVGRLSHAGDDRRAVRARNEERERLRRQREQAERDEREERERIVAARERAAAHERTRQHEEREQENTVRDERRERAQEWREQMLSAAYEHDMRGSRLAKFWRVDRVSAGIRFANARGSFVDRGDVISSTGGALDMETRGIAELAAVKGWDQLIITGDDDFVRAMMAAAEARGLEVRGSEQIDRLRASMTRDADRDRDLDRDDRGDR